MPRQFMRLGLTVLSWAFAAALLWAAPTALAQAAGQIDAPASVEADTPGDTPLDQLPTDYTEFPDMTGGWDIYLDTEGDDVTGYAGTFVFGKSAEFFFFGQDVDPETGRLISPVAIARGTWNNGDGKPGWRSWSYGSSADHRYFMNARLLSADVAIIERGARPSAERVQRMIMVRNACDFRFSDTPSPEVSGCHWARMVGFWLEDAYLTGECQFGGPCYRLMSAEYYRYAYQQIEPS